MDRSTRANTGGVPVSRYSVASEASGVSTAATGHAADAAHRQLFLWSVPAGQSGGQFNIRRADFVVGRWNQRHDKYSGDRELCGIWMLMNLDTVQASDIGRAAIA